MIGIIMISIIIIIIVIDNFPPFHHSMETRIIKKKFSKNGRSCRDVKTQKDERLT